MKSLPGFGWSTACLAVAAICSAYAWAGPGDWLTVGGDGSQSKYSSLNQITAANVPGLVKTWTFDAGGGSLTPIAVNGIVYYSSGGKVFALDGDTGKPVWQTD